MSPYLREGHVRLGKQQTGQVLIVTPASLRCFVMKSNLTKLRSRGFSAPWRSASIEDWGFRHSGSSILTGQYHLSGAANLSKQLCNPDSRATTTRAPVAGPGPGSRCSTVSICCILLTLTVMMISVEFRSTCQMAGVKLKEMSNLIQLGTEDASTWQWLAWACLWHWASVSHVGDIGRPKLSRASRAFHDDYLLFDISTRVCCWHDMPNSQLITVPQTYPNTPSLLP